MFNTQQKASLNLIYNDLRYIYTILNNSKQFNSNYIISAMPYIGLIIDGLEDWVEAYNNSSKTQINIPLFTEQEKYYYEKMRASIKLWDDSYDNIEESLRTLYESSKDYFASKCKLICKKIEIV